MTCSGAKKDRTGRLGEDWYRSSCCALSVCNHLHSFTFICIICIHLHHLHSFTFIHIICIIKNQCANCKRIGLRYLRCKKIHLSVMEVLIHCDPSQWNSSVPTHNGNNCMTDASGPPHMEPGGTPRKGATMDVFGPALESNCRMLQKSWDQLGLMTRIWMYIATWLWTSLNNQTWQFQHLIES